MKKRRMEILSTHKYLSTFGKQYERKDGGEFLRDLTIVKIFDSRIMGVAGVEVRHKRGNILCGCQHLVDNIAHKEKTWQETNNKGESQIRSILHCPGMDCSAKSTFPLPFPQALEVLQNLLLSRSGLSLGRPWPQVADTGRQ